MSTWAFVLCFCCSNTKVVGIGLAHKSLHLGPLQPLPLSLVASVLRPGCIDHVRVRQTVCLGQGKLTASAEQCLSWLGALGVLPARLCTNKRRLWCHQVLGISDMLSVLSARSEGSKSCVPSQSLYGGVSNGRYCLESFRTASASSCICRHVVRRKTELQH